MQTLTKKKKIWLIVGICALVLCIGFVAAMLLWKFDVFEPQAEPTQPVQTTQATETTEAPTEETTEPPTEPTEPPVTPNRFTPDDFAYVGDYLTCVSEECQMGIDVSKYQGYIDWKQVKEAGFTFVMIRVGYRGYGEAGTMRPDDMANSHYWGAKEAGLQIGAYFFSQATNEEEAREEALYALELTKDWELDLPIVYDWEYISEEARTAEVDADTLTACCMAFCQEISDAGRKTMIYVSPWFGNLHLDQLNEYPQWIALYKDHMDYKHHFDMWQYTCTGSVPGVKGDVDINIFFPYWEGEEWP
jgi:GH25 family lysozyme M1 (1,4-beta-N-acetylmuramidase)